nr:hypothetical protein [Desulforamulus aquiferis]
MRKILLILLIILMALSFVACTKGADMPTNNATDKENSNLMTDTADKLGITHQDYPRIDGSTSTLSIVRQSMKHVSK